MVSTKNSIDIIVMYAFYSGQPSSKTSDSWYEYFFLWISIITDTLLVQHRIKDEKVFLGESRELDSNWGL